MIELPVVDLQHYKATGDRNECLKAAESLHKYGVLCLRDEVGTAGAAFCATVEPPDGSLSRCFALASSARATKTTTRSST